MAKRKNPSAKVEPEGEDVFVVALVIESIAWALICQLDPAPRKPAGRAPAAFTAAATTGRRKAR